MDHQNYKIVNSKMEFKRLMNFILELIKIMSHLRTLLFLLRVGSNDGIDANTSRNLSQSLCQNLQCSLPTQHLASFIRSHPF